jgi:hypothetical protein
VRDHEPIRRGAAALIIAVAGMITIVAVAAGQAYVTPPPCVLKNPCVAAPIAGTNVDVRRAGGRVLIKLRGQSLFVPLVESEQIPLGAVIDAIQGRVTLCAAKGSGAGYACATFFAGKFRVTQTGHPPITVLTLVGGRFGVCSRRGHRYRSARAAAARARRRAPVRHAPVRHAPARHAPVRQLWGSGHGSFRTVGRSATATVRGTIWLTADYCDGTLVRVTRDRVLVRNRRTHAARVVVAPHHAFVPLR